MSLNGGLDRLLREAVKLNPGLSWRPQEDGDARAIGYLLKKATNRKWNQSNKVKCVVVNKAKKNWRSEQHFDIQHEDAEFGVCLARFPSHFDVVFLHYALFPMFLE